MLMNNNQKKCLICGTLLGLIFATEATEVACHVCGHVHEPELPERQVVVYEFRSSVASVSGAPDSTFTIPDTDSRYYS
jgi:hypothetical protein